MPIYSFSVEFVSEGLSSKTFFGRIHSKKPNVNQVGRIKPIKKRSTQNAKPAINKNINNPNPLIITRNLFKDFVKVKN